MRSGALVFLAVAVMLVGGASRLVYIEYTQGAALRSSAEGQQQAAYTIPAQRGYIVDARGRVLAGSVRRPSIFVDPLRVEDPYFAAHSVAPVLGLSARELADELVARRDTQFYWVKRRISDGELEQFNHVRSARRLTAFGVQFEPIREYTTQRLAAQVLGFVNAENQGQAGIELEFDSYLKGTDGRRRAIVDVRRRRLREQPEEFVAPADGATVVLTLDAQIQHIAEQEIRQAVEQHKAEWGAAVVLDPSSGEVLAMAIYPDFDPAQPIPPGLSEKQAAAAAERLRNHAIAYQYEPGSIFKPFIAAPAFEEGITRIGETFAINGPARQFGVRTIHDTKPYDVLLFEEIISKSSNIGMALIGMRCGNGRLHRYVRNWGFGDRTGITLPGEATGLVNDFSRWGPFTTQSIPMGQEITVTPLQIVTAFAAFCNDGILMRPRIVRGIVNAAGETLWDNSQPIAVRRVLDADMVRTFRREALVRVVESGTGTRARFAGYQVFGKTGTAEIAGARGAGYLEHQYVGSFVGGAPANEPRACVVVSIYKPHGEAYYGGTIAAPAAGRILGGTLNYLGVPADPNVGEVKLPAAQRSSGGAGD